MKNYWGIIAVLGLMCLIPAIVYFSFSDHREEEIGYLPSSIPTGLKGGIKAQNSDYTAQIKVVHPPLKTGAQQLLLEVHNLKANKLVNPNVTVTMPMGQETMDATVSIRPAVGRNQYQIKADITMLGIWVVTVIPAPGEKALKLQMVAQ